MFGTNRYSFLIILFFINIAWPSLGNDNIVTRGMSHAYDIKNKTEMRHLKKGAFSFIGAGIGVNLVEKLTQLTNDYTSSNTTIIPIISIHLLTVIYGGCKGYKYAKQDDLAEVSDKVSKTVVGSVGGLFLGFAWHSSISAGMVAGGAAGYQIGSALFDN